MKFNFKKVTAIATSVLLTGMTVGSAIAASDNSLVDANITKVVYGSGASALDQTQAVNIENYIKDNSDSTSTVTAGEDAITEDEVVLGGLITASGSNIETTIKNNKLNGLIDEKLSWDDGEGSDDYDVHEEIAIGTMKVLTTLDDKKLEGVALDNELGLEYKYIFEDALNVSAVGEDEADSLYLTILGKDYEITSMTEDSITVTTSDEVSMAIDQTYTLSNGKTVTLTDVYSDSVEVTVDGKSEVVDKDATKRINGVRVKVSSVGYHDNAPETSKAILKIGEDISKTYNNGDEYIGQDEDDPLWVWDISGLEESNGYIGVKYNAKIDSANDEIAGDSIKYVGEGYVFPDNYAAVTLDSITDAAYQDLKVYFEDSEDLFSAADGSTARAENQPVLVIEGENSDTITVAGHETSKIYAWFNSTNGKVETYYSDVDGDYTPTNKMRLANATAGTVDDAEMSQTELATAEIGDTNLDIDLKVVSGVATLVITNDDDSDSNVVDVTIGGTAINTTAATGTFEYLGASKEDAESGDVYFQDEDVSTEDYSYMDHYGVYIAKDSKVSDDADDDEVILSVPEEQVYAQVSVSMGATSSSSTGSMIVKDTEGYSGANVVIVGGSCVNAAAAEALGVSEGTCGADFTAATGVAAGQFLIKETTLNGKTAIVVAGYDADDTVKAAQYVINNGVVPGVYSTATQEAITA